MKLSHHITLCTTLQTPLGLLRVGLNDEHVLSLRFSDSDFDGLASATSMRVLHDTDGSKEMRILQQLCREFAEYFRGERTRFELPFCLGGTPFQQEVWHGLSSLAFGQTRTYRQHAESIMHPQGARAVGRALGANRLAIVVPCHRVVGARGSLCGYNAKLWRKKSLLELEQNHMRQRT
jgi:AraC family transcriptional regulator, regulatory protein of adaptative response / methylated-DNA-[protein]-cysteine methyltransferase